MPDMRNQRVEPVSSLPGFWKYPSFRDDGLKSPMRWLDGRRKDEDVGGLWRVHDDLYDFSSWIHNHPGGSDWLNMTKGTDITEAFESHHVAKTAELLLPHFHVRKATAPRNSPYTFLEDGFYRTLKRRVREALRGRKRGHTLHSMLTADALLAAAFVSAVFAGALGSYALGALSGVLLAFTTIAAHNFFHQKDNVRMYYFDLSLMSSRHWRVSHALSHHLFTNSIMDLEISLFEPFLEYLPKMDKTWLKRYGPIMYSPVIYISTFFIQYVQRIFSYIKKVEKGPRTEDFIPFILPLTMYLLGDCEMKDAVIMWLWILTVGSFTFSVVGLNAAHHHPEIFHDGDIPRDNLDWGVQQLDAVQDRPIISRSKFLALITFGNHVLHHLFPTMDHGNLDSILPIVTQTCKEFQVGYTENTVLGLIKGQFQQCARNVPNTIGAEKKIS